MAGTLAASRGWGCVIIHGVLDQGIETFFSSFDSVLIVYPLHCISLS